MTRTDRPHQSSVPLHPSWQVERPFIACDATMAAADAGRPKPTVADLWAAVDRVDAHGETD